MKRFSLSVLVVGPALILGLSSCSSLDQTRTRLAEWKEKREEQRLARAVAEAEKEIAEEAATTGLVAPTHSEDLIFLDYANPDGLMAEGSEAGAGPELPGTELPVMLDLATMEAEGPSGHGPIFLGEASSADGLATRLDADLVRAWASSISPIMGASLTEPLITAAMTAGVTPTDAAVAAHSAENDLARLASAFAGQAAETTLRPATSEMEHD